MKTGMLLLGLVLFFANCKTTHVGINTTVTCPSYTTGGKIFTSFFQQKAAEYRALCYQAYNIAELRIADYRSSSGKPLAIITDIDETLLNNSSFALHQALLGKDFNLQDWYAWTAMASADTLPGAGRFLSFVQQRNIQVFYITNRDAVERAATLKNLQRFGLPNADETHLLTRETASSKEERRQRVMRDFDVILLLGDNLADFSDLFDKKSQDVRQTNTDAVYNEFGKRFIVLPNWNYGDWEGSFYNYNYSLSPSKKDSAMINGLKYYTVPVDKSKLLMK